MYQKLNGSLRHGGLVFGGGLAAAVFASVTAAVSGCPGPAPSAGAGGQTTSGSSTSSSSSSTTSTSTSISTSISGSTSTISGSALCPASSTCAPTVTGWTGPVPIYEILGPDAGIMLSSDAGSPPDGGPAVACPANEKPDMLGGTGLTWLHASCGCQCGPPSEGSCTVAATLFSSCSSSVPCGTTILTTTCGPLTSNVCAQSQPGLAVDVTVTPDGGGCMPNLIAPMPAPPAWADQWFACTPVNTPTPCEDGLCVPSPLPSALSLCIYQTYPSGSEEPACPSQYPRQTVIQSQSGLVDDRHCTDCNCVPVPVQCGDGKAQFSLGCQPVTATGIVDVPTKGCVEADAGAANGIAPSGVLLEPPPVPTDTTGASCTPDGGQSTGSVSVKDLTMICCQ